MDWSALVGAAWRAAVGFGLALTVTRILNKQLVARLTYFDFTLGVIIGALVGWLSSCWKRTCAACATTWIS